MSIKERCENITLKVNMSNLCRFCNATGSVNGFREPYILCTCCNGKGISKYIQNDTKARFRIEYSIENQVVIETLVFVGFNFEKKDPSNIHNTKESVLWKKYLRFVPDRTNPYLK